MKLHYDLFHFKRYLLYIFVVYVVRIAVFLSFMSFVLPFFAVRWRSYCHFLSFLIVCLSFFFYHLSTAVFVFRYRSIG